MRRPSSKTREKITGLGRYRGELSEGMVHVQIERIRVDNALRANMVLLTTPKHSRVPYSCMKLQEGNFSLSLYVCISVTHLSRTNHICLPRLLRDMIVRPSSEHDILSEVTSSPITSSSNCPSLCSEAPTQCGHTDNKHS